MAVSEPSHLTSLAQIIDQFDKGVATFAAYLKKVRERVQRSRKVLDSRSSSAELAKLISDLQPLKDTPEPPSVGAFAQSLDEHLGVLRRNQGAQFGELLRSACDKEHLAFSSLPNGFGLGPFLLVPNPAKEEAVLSYAKAPIANKIPMDAVTCVAKAAALKSTILDDPVDLQKFRSALKEAVRVSLARRSKPFTGALRVELPAVYRELEFIRCSERPAASKSSMGYSLARFVVELSKLVQSDENIESKHPIGLETAVLENTKDNRRSVYIPKDLACGYGEGTYYQALTLASD